MLQSHRQDGDGSGQAPGRTRQGGRDGNAGSARSSGPPLAPHRAWRVPRRSTRCTRDRTDNEPAEPDSHTDGTRQPSQSAHGQARSSRPPGFSGGRQSRRQVAAEGREGRLGRGRKSPDHERRAGREVGEQWPDEMPETTADLVADHRVPDRLGHDEAGACRGGLRRLLEKQVNDDRAAACPACATNRCGEVGATPQSLRRGQHDYLGIPARQASAQADSLSRPLERRAERMARPARVRMRSRKPWVLARRRLFGWKVRLLTSKLRLRTTSRGASKLQDATLAERGGATARPYAGPSRRSTIARPTRRLSGSSRLAVSSVCARCEAFPARGRLPGRPRVDADVTSLLACPFAGHQGCSHTTTNRAKPDKRVDRSPR